MHRIKVAEHGWEGISSLRQPFSNSSVDRIEFRATVFARVIQLTPSLMLIRKNVPPKLIEDVLALKWLLAM